MKEQLIVLAEALEGLEESNSAALVRTLALADDVLKEAEPKAPDAKKTPAQTDLLDPFKKKEPEKPAQPVKLSWPFPPPSVLINPRNFIQAALAWTGTHKMEGRAGEIKAARRYLYFLLKIEGPKLAKQLQQQWKLAVRTQDKDLAWTLRMWWDTMGDVWDLLQRMSRIMNRYEKAPGYTDKPGYF